MSVSSSRTTVTSSPAQDTVRGAGLPVTMGNTANDAGPPALRKLELSYRPYRFPGATAGYYFFEKNKWGGIVMSTILYKTNPVNTAAPLDVPRCIGKRND